MTKLNISKDLIIRSFDNFLTEDEQIVLREWLESNPANRDEYYQLLTLWNQSAIPSQSLDAELEEAWIEFKKRMSFGNRKRHTAGRFWLRAAASLILIAGLVGGSTWFLLRDQPVETTLSALEPDTPYIITPKGEKLILGADQTEIRYDHPTTSVPGSESLGELSEREPCLLELVVPRSRRINLVLSDGTKVWLNSESRFTYPEYFTQKNRQVKLEGEAYFDVAHSEQDTFIVETEKLRIEVMGTQFNVTAYHADGQTSTTLVDGSVRVIDHKTHNTRELLPGERALFPFNTGILEVALTDIELYTSWINGYLKFNSESLDQVVRKLERNYSIPILITDPALKIYQFSGKLGLQETIEQVMEVICLTAPLKYQESNGEILILNQKQ